jgi:hypothetical protein
MAVCNRFDVPDMRNVTNDCAMYVRPDLYYLCQIYQVRTDTPSITTIWWM